jgi:RsiW-degrading membrane proteinase PrsW (M82 family)
MEDANVNGQGWYYLDHGVGQGPVSSDQIRALVGAGHLATTTLVAQRGWQKWLPASEVFPELAPSSQSGTLPPPPPSAGPQNVFDPLRRHIRDFAGTEALEGFSLREMFSEVFKKRTPEELDDYFLVGSYRTTPPITEVQSGWPKPWFFFRVLLFIGVVYGAFSLAMDRFDNPNLIPGLIMMGSLAVPLSTVFLFFELNTPRNVSFAQILSLICSGGIVSLVVALFGFDYANLSWLGDMDAGIIEEIGKLAAVVILARSRRHKYILNGMLFGACVGAGFSVFESAGYAFRDLLKNENLTHMGHVIQLRAFLAPFGHVAWTAFSAGALWRVKGDRRLSPGMLIDLRFLKAFAIPVVLHMLWDSPIELPYEALQIGLGIVGWYVIFGMVQQGLRQVKAEQVAAAAAVPGDAAARTA